MKLIIIGLSLLVAGFAGLVAGFLRVIQILGEGGEK